MSEAYLLKQLEHETLKHHKISLILERRQYRELTIKDGLLVNIDTYANVDVLRI